MWGGDFAFTEIPMPCKRSPFEQQKDYIWKATPSRRVYNEQKNPITTKKTTI